MKVTHEKLPESRVRLAIEVSAEDSQKGYDRIIKDLSESVSIPGFRKGKISKQVLFQRIGQKKIKAMVLESLIQQGMEKGIEQEKLRPIGNFNVEPALEEMVEEYQPGVEFGFSASIDVVPKVELMPYEGLIVKAEEVVYDPAEVEQALENARVESAALVPVENRPAQMGDVTVLDFEGSWSEGEKAGEKIPGVEGKDFQVELEQSRLIEGFVASVVGMNIDETKQVTLTFPEDYPQEELSGKPVVFQITLKELKQKELPDLDDEFAQEISSNTFETLEQLKASLEQRYTRNAKEKTEQNIDKAIVAELIKANEIDLPKFWVEREIDNIIRRMVAQLEEYGVDYKQILTQESIPKLRENSRPEAIDTVKESLIISEIALRANITYTPLEVQERIDAFLSTSTKKDIKEIDQHKLREIVEESLMKAKVLEFLREKVTVQLVPLGSLSESPESVEETSEEVVTGDESVEETPEEVVAGDESVEENTEVEVVTPENEA